MAYTDFTAKDLRLQFGVEMHGKSLFEQVEPVFPSEWLITTLKMGRKFGLDTPKSYQERLTSPIMMELSTLNNHDFAIHSGANLDTDEGLGLYGECDFLFSFNKILDFVLPPVFYVMEAKTMNVEETAAQLVGAKIMNDTQNKPMNTIYGCATTGEEWRFMQYSDNQISVDKTCYSIKHLPKILGILQHIVEESRKQFPELAAVA